MPPDPLTLSFDTSAAHCAAALLSGDTVIARAHEEMAKGQAERLLPLLHEVLADGGVHWRDLDRIGVGIGPGNFTGVRMAVAAARGLALSLGIPAVGVSGLSALAHDTPGPVLACLNARRGAVYLQGFSPDHGPGLWPLDALPPWPVASPTCIGDLSGAVAARFGGRVATPRHPLAEAVARIAAAAPLPVGRPAPLYLRAPDAAPSRHPAPAILP